MYPPAIPLLLSGRYPNIIAVSGTTQRGFQEAHTSDNIGRRHQTVKVRIDHPIVQTEGGGVMSHLCGRVRQCFCGSTRDLKADDTCNMPHCRTQTGRSLTMITPHVMMSQ